MDHFTWNVLQIASVFDSLAFVIFDMTTVGYATLALATLFNLLLMVENVLDRRLSDSSWRGRFADIYCQYRISLCANAHF